MAERGDQPGIGSATRGVMFLLLLVEVAILLKLELMFGQGGWRVPWLLAMVGLITLPLLLLMIHLRTRQFVTADPQFHPFEPRGEADWIRQPLEWATDQLTNRGFTLCGHFHASGHVTGVLGLISLFEHVDNKTVARLIFAITKSRAEITLGFTTGFVDGTKVITTNRQRPSGLALSRERTMAWLPEIRDSSRLHAIHEELVERLNRGNKRRLLKGTAADYLRESAQKEIGRWAAAGHYRLDRAGDRYRLTWKGAVLRAWAATWPGRLFLRIQSRHRTRALLREHSILLSREDPEGTPL